MNIMKNETAAATAAGKEQPEAHLIGMKAMSYAEQQQPPGREQGQQAPQASDRAVPTDGGGDAPAI